MEVKGRKTPFVNRIAENEDSLRDLGFIAQSSFRSPSQILEIEDNLTAFALDAAVADVMLTWQNKRDHKRLESLIKSLYAMVFAWFGKKWVDPDTAEKDGEEVPEDDVL